jgi:3-oxoacyl-[acyl-carrier-protein] synthase-1
MASRMRPLVLSASTAVSALGQGAAAQGEALAARRGGLRPNDFEPAVGGWIGRVAGVEDVTRPPALTAFDCRNNRLAAMTLAADGFAEAVAEAREAYGTGRIALILGTSTSGITAGEEAYRQRDPESGALPAGFDYGRTQDLASLAGYVRATLGLRGPSLVVSTACASSARAFMDAAQLIQTGICDAAVVGGADSLCRMTLQGFAALELISPTACRPCDAARSGISIGEAAGFALLERAEAPRRDGGTGPRLALLGAGASSDGYHMSSPHPQGAGAIAAMRQALASAGLAPEAVDWVHLHGTGTRANDAMEDMAVMAVCGPETPCSSTKGYTGHTLGACGILETVLAGQCLERGFIAGCLGVTEPDPAFQSRVATGNLERPLRHVLSNSFGFGGINCSLVLGSLP